MVLLHLVEDLDVEPDFTCLSDAVADVKLGPQWRW